MEPGNEIQAYPIGMYIQDDGRTRSTGKKNDREGSEREAGLKWSSNKRGIDTTRSQRVINERYSQDFTGSYSFKSPNTTVVDNAASTDELDGSALMASESMGRGSMPHRRRSSDLPLLLYRRSAR